MDVIDKDRKLSVVWESVADFYETAPATWKGSTNRREASEALGAGGRDTSGQRPRNWLGTDSREEAIKFGKEGWPAMLVRLRKMMASMEIGDLALAASVTINRKRKRIRGEFGDELSMTRVWNGELDTAWSRPARVPRMIVTQRHATVYINLAANAYCTAEQVLWRGAAAMFICDILQKAGRSVEIYVGSTQQDSMPRGPRLHSTAIRVKPFDMPLHEEMLAAQVTPAFFRTVGFAAICSTEYDISSGLGRAAGGGILPAQLQARRDAGELVVAIDDCLNRESAEEKVREVIAGLSAEAKEVA